MKKIITLSLALMLIAVMFNACKPEPEPTEQNETSEENIKKKYLVREYCYGRLLKEIYWNDDFSQIDSIYSRPYASDLHSLSYCFTYYDDSIEVRMKDHQNCIAGNLVFGNKLIIHLENKNIKDIHVYFDDEIKRIKQYNYDSDNKLVSITCNDSIIEPGCAEFKWSCDNVMHVNAFTLGVEVFYYDKVNDFINPYYTLPFVLFSESWDYPYFILSPLWKNTVEEDGEEILYECDEDNWLTKKYYIDTLNDTLVKYSYEYDY